MRLPLIKAFLLAAWLSAHVSPGLAQSFADEDRDWGVVPQERIRSAPYTAPTPTVIPGATVIATRDLRSLVEAVPGSGPNDRPVLVDVASGEGHATLPGAIWIPGAGRGTSFVDPLQAQFVDLMSKITGGDKSRAVVFFCVNVQCWLSYNAALRAVAAGYTRVSWYRGGIASWRDAGLHLATITPAAGP